MKTDDGARVTDYAGGDDGCNIPADCSADRRPGNDSEMPENTQVVLDLGA
jgi:hypothetical protein